MTNKTFKDSIAKLDQIITDDLKRNHDTILGRINHLNENYGVKKIESFISKAFNISNDDMLSILPTVFAQPPCKRVVLLKYANKEIVTIDGKYFCRKTASTSSEDILNICLEQSEINNTTLETHILPEILWEDDDTISIIELSEKIGIMSIHGDIFSKIKNSKSHIFVNSNPSVNGFVCNYLEALYEEWNEEAGDIIVWSPSTVDENYNFSFNQLCKAQTNDGDSWFISSGDKKIEIVFSS